MTPAGQKAKDIAAAAWQDKSRVAAALAQLGELAAKTSGQALREVQSYATMLSRLAG